jgi:hypothetical protein
MPGVEFDPNSNVIPLFGPTPEEFEARVELMDDQLQVQPVDRQEVPVTNIGMDAKVQLLVIRSRDTRLTPLQRFTAAVLADELRQSLITGQ